MDWIRCFLDDSNEELQIYSLGWGVGFQCMMVCYPYCGNGAVIMTNSDLGVHQMEGIIGEVVKRYPYNENKEAVPSSFFIYIIFRNNFYMFWCDNLRYTFLEIFM